MLATAAADRAGRGPASSLVGAGSGRLDPAHDRLVTPGRLCSSGAEPARSQASRRDALGRGACQPLRLRRGLRVGRWPSRRPQRRVDRGTAPGRLLPEVPRRKSRTGVRPEDDRGLGLGLRRRVCGPGEALRREDGCGDGPDDGLRQLPGSPPAVPRLADGEGWPAASARHRLRAGGSHHATARHDTENASIESGVVGDPFLGQGPDPRRARVDLTELRRIAGKARNAEEQSHARSCAELGGSGARAADGLHDSQPSRLEPGLPGLPARAGCRLGDLLADVLDRDQRQDGPYLRAEPVLGHDAAP